MMDFEDWWSGLCPKTKAGKPSQLLHMSQAKALAAMAWKAGTRRGACKALGRDYPEGFDVGVEKMLGGEKCSP